MLKPASSMHERARSILQSPIASSWSKSQSASHVSERVLALFLGITLSILSYSLTLITQSTLATGRFKFPFPLGATYIQLIIAHVLLSLLGMLCVIQSFFFESHQYSPLGREQSAQQEESSLGISGKLPNRTFSLWILPKLKEYALLACILTGKVLAMNCSLAYSDSHNYEQAQLMSFALLLAYDNFSEKQHSASYFTSSLIAVLNISLANARPNIRFPWESFLSAAFSSIFGAVFLRVLHSACNIHEQPESHVLNDAMPSTPRKSVQAQLFACWGILYYTTLVSVFALTPAVLLSGEAVSIWRDYYFYTDRSFLLLMLARGALTWGLCVVTVLLVQASGPVFTAFVPAFQIAVQILWFHRVAGLEHARVVVGALSCVWFWLVS